MASSSTTGHNQTELENAFEQSAPYSTSPSAEPRQNIYCLTEVIKLLQEWCRSILNVLERLCAVPFLVIFWASRVGRQTQPDPQNAFDQLATFSASKSTEPCQIFINHRGSDVKYTLASKIHHTLDGMGFRAFLDVEALEPGDVISAEIQAAMNSASLHIAIFSPNYAQSAWCLTELSFILKTGAKIIPIFYHVKPSDLRWIEQGNGIYAHAFSEHGKKCRYTQEKLNEWKGALYNISFHSGFQVNNNEDEARVLKNIVNCALKDMKNAPLWVAEHPLGLDELVQDFESVASVETVKIRGIVGMGGSGKTTLAKELFNMNFSSFERCSFVSDVGDAASRNALPDKQKKLLEDLGVHHLSFDSVDEGKAILANRLCSLRALIVLDDVDHIDQVNALLPNKHNLGSQSMVILTTRELGVLKSSGLSPSCIYKMPRLNRSHAEQLFCWHAFLQPSPPAGFETLVGNFIRACDGLPLSLKLLGGQLYGRDSRAYWESQLNKISRILPADIKERLQVSYDALDDEEKEMFLDVACFLIGELKSTAIAVWDGSGWSGLHGLETLVNKCLVELVYDRGKNPSDGNIIRMHDHLRDMGREIASKHSSYRLWFPKKIVNMKKDSMERQPIRGIKPADAFVAFKEYTYRLTGESSRRSKHLCFSNGLQILSVKGNEFNEDFASLSEDLVWLRWEGFPLRNLPSWLTLRNLSVLELHGANELEELWEDDLHPPLQLRELIILGKKKLQWIPSSIGRLQYLKKLVIHFHGSSLPKELCGLQSLEYLSLSSRVLLSLPAGFGNLLSLRSLYLMDCFQLSTLPDSFQQLKQLKYLNLLGCKMLSSLPVGFGKLVNLRNINLGFCVQLKLLPESFEQLTQLEDLNLSYCKMLFSLPAGFGNLISLQNINMKSCIQLSMLPDSFKQLIHLKDLNLSGCKMLSSLPVDFGNLISLQNINLESCIQLSTLPDSFKQLIHLISLNLSGCEMLSSLPAGFDNLIRLQNINLKSCIQLTTLPDSFMGYCGQLRILPNSFKHLIHLEDLNLSHCKMLSTLPTSFGNLISLRNINLKACIQLSMLPDSFDQLTHLEDLNLSGCKMLSSLPAGFGNLIGLRNINMKSCIHLRMLPDSFNQLIHLEDLDLSDCQMLFSLPADFGNLKSLRNINLGYCGQLGMLPDSFKQLTHLEDLNLSHCKMLSSLPDGFENLISLRNVNLESCIQLSTLPDSFKQLIHLEDLNFSSCKMVSSLPDGFDNLIGLRNINLNSCIQLSRLPDSFDQLIHLEDLNLSGCKSLSSLPIGFGNLISLRNINLQSCIQLCTLSNSIKQLIHLVSLNLSGCKMLSSLPADFGNLIGLRSINLKSCIELRTLPDSFKQLIHLEDLNLSGCTRLKLRLDMLENIRKLKVFNLSYCEDLEDLPHQIINQASLTKLDLQGCINLRGVPTNIGEVGKFQWLTIETLTWKSLQTALVNLSSFKSIEIVSSEREMAFDTRAASSLKTLNEADIEDCKRFSRISISNGCCPNLGIFMVSRNRHLMEIETLPVSLNMLTINHCKVLTNIRSISGLVNLEKLIICDCPQIEDLSSFVGLASLKEFEIWNCPKVDKIEGLERSKSLKSLSAKTCWKVPGIKSLEKVEQLETLVLECDAISALKPCIQSIKECPREMRIRGSVIRFVKSIVNSLEFPDLSVMELEEPSDVYKIPHSFDSAACLCYVEEKEENDEERKVVHIYVYLKNNYFGKGEAVSFFRDRSNTDGNFQGKSATVVMGEGGRVVEAFNQLFELLE